MHRIVSPNIVSPNIVSNNVNQNIVNHKRTTLSPNYPCDKCGEPAMVSEGGGLRCPRCWLAEKGKQIKPLDHAGYYP